jgi:hypothetical protein
MGFFRAKTTNKKTQDATTSLTATTSRLKALRIIFHSQKHDAETVVVVDASSTRVNPAGDLRNSSSSIRSQSSPGQEPSLWDRAYDALKSDEPRLVKNFEQLLLKKQYLGSLAETTLDAGKLIGSYDYMHHPPCSTRCRQTSYVP